jgi:plastocyanin
LNENVVAWGSNLLGSSRCNEDEVVHFITTVSRGVIDSGSIIEGGSWSRTFTDPSTYNFACQIHPAMKMTLTVESDHAK